MNTHIGKKIVGRRRRLGLSQRDLAERIGTSQATISRLERAAEPDLDPRLIAHIASELGCALTDIVPERTLDKLMPSGSDHFYAFCPNPFCQRNKYGFDGSSGSVVVWWNSGTAYSVERFAEINFCFKCGTGLVKECPSCKKKLEQPGTQYCETCGTQLSERPTEDEWSDIRKRVEAEQPQASDLDPDDIPF